MKKIILLIILLTFSGCTIDYNVTINKNGKIEDYLFMTELKTVFDMQKPSDWNIIKSSKINHVNLKNELEKYEAYYEIDLQDDYYGYDEYYNNDYFKRFIGDYKLTEGETNKIDITFNENLIVNLYGKDAGVMYYSPTIEELNISVNFPYKVINSNASSLEDNTLLWSINKDNVVDGIHIEYSNPTIVEQKKDKLYYSTILIIAVAIIIFVIVVKIKNKKTNAI